MLLERLQINQLEQSFPTLCASRNNFSIDTLAPIEKIEQFKMLNFSIQGVLVDNFWSKGLIFFNIMVVWLLTHVIEITIEDTLNILVIRRTVVEKHWLSQREIES